MSTDLEKREQALVPNLETGELLDLATAESGDVAHALFAIRQKESELKEMKRMVGEELNRRLDANASWTEHMGAFQVKGTSPQPSREADIEPLRAELYALMDEGQVSSRAAENALEATVVYKAKWNGIDALRKLGGEVKERIDKHIREVEKKRYAPSVSMDLPK